MGEAEQELTSRLQAVEDRQREITDRQEIHDVLMRYCRGADRADAELLLSAFFADAVCDYGTPTPAATFVPAVAAASQKQLMHFTGNILIELDGDSAFVESYFLSFSPFEEDGVTSTRTRAGRYLDRFERRDGEWRIAHRVLVNEWGRLDELTRPLELGGHSGVRGDRGDAIFHIRELLS